MILGPPVWAAGSWGAVNAWADGTWATLVLIVQWLGTTVRTLTGVGQ